MFAPARMRPSASRASAFAHVPFVSVPVLSKVTVSTAPIRSSASPVLTSTPRFVAWPIAAITEVGVASASAHGQNVTSTVTARVRLARSPMPSAKWQTTSVARATQRAAGTRIDAQRSARRCIGALWLFASLTRRMIFSRLVSAPTAVARISTRP